jgi:putative hydroxymethylpyrimidine transport system substrate-binding protein
MILRPALLLSLLTLIVLVTGCGEKQERLEPSGSKRVELMLDYFPNADHAGIYAAQADGNFEQAGLDVTIRQPPDPAAPIKQVAAGRVDLAISYEPEVLRARDQGLDVVAVAAIVRKPLTSIISLPKAHIGGPRDLAHKTVGTAGIDYQSAYLQTILDDAGIDADSVKERNVGFSLVPALVSGKVDAILGGFWNYEGVQLRRAGKRPRIIRIEDAGVPTYDELVLVANGDALGQDRDRIRAFVGALSRGTQALSEDPDTAIEGLLKANPDLDPGLQRAVVKTTLPLLLPAHGKPFGWQSPAEWDAFSAWMRENQLLERPADPRSAATNDLLPGSGL